MRLPSKARKISSSTLCINEFMNAFALVNFIPLFQWSANVTRLCVSVMILKAQAPLPLIGKPKRWLSDYHLTIKLDGSGRTK